MSFKKILVASTFAVVASAGVSFADDGNEGIAIRDDINNNNADQGIMLEGRSSTMDSPDVYVEQSPNAYGQEAPVEEGSEFSITDEDRSND